MLLIISGINEVKVRGRWMITIDEEPAFAPTAMTCPLSMMHGFGPNFTAKFVQDADGRLEYQIWQDHNNYSGDQHGNEKYPLWHNHLVANHSY